MPKRSAPAYSPFAVLKTAKQSDVQESEQLASQMVDSHAKSKNPAYTKFTIYIQKSTHRAAKLKALQNDRELSGLVEELLVNWLKT